MTLVRLTDAQYTRLALRPDGGITDLRVFGLAPAFGYGWWRIVDAHRATVTRDALRRWGRDRASQRLADRLTIALSLLPAAQEAA